MAALDSIAHAQAPRVWPVAALVLAASDALAARFGAVAVRGEISGLTRAASGHLYFSLKDSEGAPALLRCAMFRRAASLVPFVPANGQQVQLRGRLGVYEARGELQLVVEAMSRVGEGSLYEEFLRRRAVLQAEGLFDAALKRPVPAAPAAVGVVTSADAAALRDVLSTLARRAPHVRVVIYPSPVQGPAAPQGLIDALGLAARRAEVDTLLLVRGGGSLEDLQAFNDERLVRAVRASPLPVICGVGHETDITLADLAADLRAPTPTAAAELAAPDVSQTLERLQALALRASGLVQRRLQAQAVSLDRASFRLAAPAALLRPQQQRLAHLAMRAQRAALAALLRQQRRCERQAQALLAAVAAVRQRQGAQCEQLAWRLQALDPAHVLARGYALLADEEGRTLASVSALSPGQAVVATLADGTARLTVKDVAPRQ